jgi:hypothetical protein
MSQSQHRHNSMQFTQNQKNEMSDDPRDGARNSDTVGRDGPPTPVERSPEAEEQDQSAIEAFGRKGAGAGKA